MARRLVTEGKTYADAAAATGIPLSTIQKRAGEEKWQANKGAAKVSYAETAKLLKQDLLEAVLKARQDGVGANEVATLLASWEKVERVFPERYYAAQAEDPRQRLELALEMLEEWVEFLGEVDPDLLTRIQGRARTFM
ncbi:MAG TPA: hypothetical protein PKW90_09340, partial [Myxococcota bacterium]|nr:hypothetical protein [Myxococcota bacterium]